MNTLSSTFHQKLTTRLAIAAMLFLPVVAGATLAKADSSDLVSSLPAQIPEILTGGSWTNGDVGGVYRAVVVLSKTATKKPDLLSKTVAGKIVLNTKKPKAERKAEVFIQWIAYDGGKATSKIVKTVSIKEFNEKQLRHAFLAMDTLKDNEMTLLVTSYDENRDKDVSITVKATKPGEYIPSKSEH